MTMLLRKHGAWIGLALCCLVLAYFLLPLRERKSPAVQPAEVKVLEPAVFVTNQVLTNAARTLPHNALNMVKAADFSASEKAAIEDKFNSKMKPAIETWLTAYAGHVPFGLNDVTFATFHNRVGRNASYYVYTFVFDGMTLTVQESNGVFKVNYLMVRQAALAINSTPAPGGTPDLSVPVSSDEVRRLVKADTGVEFQSNEVIIRPTGAASALNGGAFVNLLPTGKDPNNALNYKIMMVFGSDGNLVNYERDPFF